jgi:hypothetical protein
MSRPGRAISLQTPAKRWVTIVALLAFFLQSLVVQTHIHQPVQPFQTVAAHLPGPAPLKGPDPIDQCRLCQELVHAGAFVTPSASTGLTSMAIAATVFSAAPNALVSLTRAFAWQSRAPPRR